MEIILGMMFCLFIGIVIGVSSDTKTKPTKPKQIESSPVRPGGGGDF